MSNLLPMGNNSSMDDSDPNQKRAKLISKLILLIPIAAIVWYIFPILTGLVNNITDLTTAIIRCSIVAGIGLALFLVFKALSAGFLHGLEKLNSRWLDMVIANNPTESMRIEIAKAEQQRKERTSGLGELTSAINSMQDIQRKQTEEMVELLELAGSLKKRAEKSTDVNEQRRLNTESQTAANKASYKQQSNKRIEPNLLKFKNYSSKMEEIANAMNFFINDRKNLCDQLEQDWLLSKKLKKTAQTISSNLSLDDDNSIYRRASRIAQQDIINNMATVEAAFESSKEIVAQAATEQGILEIQSNKLVDRFNNGEFDQAILLMNTQTSLEELKDRARRELTTGQSTSIQTNPLQQNTQFDELFNKNN